MVNEPEDVSDASSRPSADRQPTKSAERLKASPDIKEPRIFLGVPLGTATSPNKILMLDYRDLNDAGMSLAKGGELPSRCQKKPCINAKICQPS